MCSTDPTTAKSRPPGHGGGGSSGRAASSANSPVGAAVMRAHDVAAALSGSGDIITADSLEVPGPSEAPKPYLTGSRAPSWLEPAPQTSGAHARPAIGAARARGPGGHARSSRYCGFEPGAYLKAPLSDQPGPLQDRPERVHPSARPLPPNPA